MGFGSDVRIVPCRSSGCAQVQDPVLFLPGLPNPSHQPQHPWLWLSHSRAVTSHAGATELNLFLIYFLMRYHQKRLVKGFGLLYT